ncbi:MAG: hypothetical protein U0V87_13730 [Acidobacteriota bacterium]
MGGASVYCRLAVPPVSGLLNHAGSIASAAGRAASGAELAEVGSLFARVVFVVRRRLCGAAGVSGRPCSYDTPYCCSAGPDEAARCRRVLLPMAEVRLPVMCGSGCFHDLIVCFAQFGLAMGRLRWCCGAWYWRAWCCVVGERGGAWCGDADVWRCDALSSSRDVGSCAVAGRGALHRAALNCAALLVWRRGVTWPLHRAASWPAALRVARYRHITVLPHSLLRRAALHRTP